MAIASLGPTHTPDADRWSVGCSCTPLPSPKDDGPSARGTREIAAAAAGTAPPPGSSAGSEHPSAQIDPRAAHSDAGDAPAGTSFPPANVAPPAATTTQAGDGVWQPLADGARDGRVAMARTRIHNHRLDRHKYIEAIAFDLALVDVVLVAGKLDPQSTTVPSEKRTGLVPPADHDALIAVFNGGFLQKHGKWGFMLDGDIYTPQKDDGCTIVRSRGGSLRIATWTALAGASDAAWWRQAPPCLIEGGVVNPRLAREGGTTLWGKAIGGATEIRRSALALDDSRRTMFYVFSEWNTVQEFAEALKALGVSHAAELDVNWSYTRFFLFDHPPGGPPLIRETIVPKLEFNPRKYTERAADRDFFYVRLRSRAKG